MVPIAYARMGTRSRRAMVRTQKAFGRPYEYRPRITLVRRLSQELGLTLEQTLDQIQKEREFLISRKT
jgi:hypothetical protein